MGSSRRVERLAPMRAVERDLIEAAIAWYRSCGESGPAGVAPNSPQGVMVAAVEAVIASRQRPNPNAPEHCGLTMTHRPHTWGEYDNQWCPGTRHQSTGDTETTRSTS